MYIFEKRFYSLIHSWQTSQLSVNEALDLFTDISSYISSFELADITLESADIIIKNISLLTDFTLDHLHIILEKSISDLKTLDSPSDRTIYFYIKQVLSIYNSVLNLKKEQLNMNVNVNIYFAEYCSLWLYDSSQRIIGMTKFLKTATNRWEQIQILSDLVYLYSIKYLHYKSFKDFETLTKYYNQMVSVFSASRNIPSVGIYSYSIARLYYSICYTVHTPKNSDKQFIIQELRALPALQKQMLQLDDPVFYNRLNSLISKICTRFEEENIIDVP